MSQQSSGREPRYGQREQLQDLLVELAPQLAADRTLERELDRHLARRFNAFEYLRTDELGLSRVIADLLDPAHEHGQGTTFLQAMLDAFSQTRERFTRLLSSPASPIVVRRERVTGTGGRIDITVDIPDGNRSFCLAFENKPHARESAGQLTAYLKYLSEQYEERFLLVYLPPSGEGPSGADLSRADRELWEHRLVVMPYTGRNSLAEWFAACRRRCEAERVRAFLRDGELFCGRVSGGSTTMTTNRATRTAVEYLRTKSEHLRTALAVHDAWSLLRDEVCEQFLEHVRAEVEDRLSRELADKDLHVRCRYGGDKPYSNKLWIVRDAWIQYDGETDPPELEGRTVIRLQAGANRGRGGPNGWYWGVSSPKDLSVMTASEKERRDRLHGKLLEKGLRLARRSSSYWLQFEYLKRYADWYPLVPDLHEECESGGGPITTYYADHLFAIARFAIKAIDEVEHSTSNSGH